MTKKNKRHGYAERLAYMHMLEDGRSLNYIGKNYGINTNLLGQLWVKYQSNGPAGLLKKKNIRADYALKVNAVKDIEENRLTLVDASLKYDVSASRLTAWLRLARAKGYDALSAVKPRGRPPGMGRPKKKAASQMTEVERLRQENQELKTELALLKKVRALVDKRNAQLREIGRGPSKD